MLVAPLAADRGPRRDGRPDAPCWSSRSRARSTRRCARSVPDGGSVLVVGAGTVGILTLLAVRGSTQAGPVIVGGQAPRAARRRAAGGRRRGRAARARGEGGPPRASRGEAHARARPGLPARRRGRRDRVRGLHERARPGAAHHQGRRARRAERRSRRPGADLTPLWFRELELVGAYTGGIEHDRRAAAARHRSTLAIEIATQLARCSTRWSARRTRSTDGARRSTTRCRPDGSARSRWRSRRRRTERDDEETSRCPDQDSCWRSTNGRRRCWSTRARGSACSGSRWGRASCIRPTRCPGSAT